MNKKYQDLTLNSHTLKTNNGSVRLTKCFSERKIELLL